MKLFLSKFARDGRGVAALEYALLAGFITVGVALALTNTGIGTSVANIFSNLGDGVTAASTASDGGTGG